jgi:hypothetical protein
MLAMNVEVEKTLTKKTPSRERKAERPKGKYEEPNRKQT